jgi:Arc/MetJ-type ribon-helix-helix transcriptional regulator
MTITLNAELEALVNAKLATGRFETHEDVIGEALISMEQNTEEYTEWLGQEVQIGIDQLQRGESAPLEPLAVLLAEARAYSKTAMPPTFEEFRHGVQLGVDQADRGEFSTRTISDIIAEAVNQREAALNARSDTLSGEMQIGIDQSVR